jgi:hypothetical protein
MFTTLQNVRHAVRTVYGDSSAEYGGTLWVVPVHVLGQANGAGLQHGQWLVLQF